MNKPPSSADDLEQATVSYQQAQYAWQADTSQYYTSSVGAGYVQGYDSYGQPEYENMPANAPLPPAKRQKAGTVSRPKKLP